MSDVKIHSKIHRAFLLLILSCLLYFAIGDEELEERKRFYITGKVQIRNVAATKWIAQCRVVAEGPSGRFVGYLRKDGSFVISSVPSGTYVVEVHTPNYVFEPVRVDVTKNGKIRARKVNFLKLSSVETVPYPLKFICDNRAPFFKQRESLSLIAMVTNNPMILYLIIPALLLLVLPKLMGNLDENAQKEMQESMSMFTQFQDGSMPSIEEKFTSFFGGGSKAKKPRGKPQAAISAGGVRKKK